jgi:hypothetical protein
VLVITRSVGLPEDLEAAGRAGHNEIILMHPDAGRIVIRLLPSRGGRGVSVGIDAPRDVEVQRGERDRAGAAAAKGGAA